MRNEKLLKARTLFEPVADSASEGREGRVRERRPEFRNAYGKNSTRKISLRGRRARNIYVFAELHEVSAYVKQERMRKRL